MPTLLLFGLGSFFFLVTTGFAVLFHILSGHAETDMADGCLGLYICLIGSVASMSCYYFAVML